MYTFNGFAKLLSAMQLSPHGVTSTGGTKREISLEYLTEEKFYPLGTTDEYFEAPYEEYPITICTVRLLSSPMGSLPPPCYLCQRRTGKSFSFTFWALHTAGNRGNVRTLPEYDRVSNPQDFTASAKRKWRCFRMGKSESFPYETIVRATSGEPEAVDEFYGITASESESPPLKTDISTGIRRTV